MYQLITFTSNLINFIQSNNYFLKGNLKIGNFFSKIMKKEVMYKISESKNVSKTVFILTLDKIFSSI